MGVLGVGGQGSQPSQLAMTTPEGLDKLDYTIKYDVGLGDWTRIRLAMDVQVVSTLDMTPQRCVRRRGLFGKREAHDEGSHLEGKVAMAEPAEGETAAPIAALDNKQWVGFRVRATYILDLE